MIKNIGVDAAKLAGLQIDQNQKLRDGSMTIEQMEWWLTQSNETRESLMNGDLVISEPICRWAVDEDGVIRFQLTGLGLTSQEWISRLESKGHKLSKWAKDVLNSPDFVSCEKGKIYNLAVLPGRLFSDDKRTTKNIRAEGHRRNLKHGKAIPTEIGCLIRENFTNKEIEQMGLGWLVIMHESVKVSDGDPVLLCTNWNDDGSWLRAPWDEPGDRWDRGSGFVFLASQD